MFLQKVVGPNLHRSKKKHTEEDIPIMWVYKREAGPGLRVSALSECRQSFAVLLNEEITWEEGGDWG